MKLIRNLTLSLALASAGIAVAATENAPDILIPEMDGARVIHGLSNNGKYGVASVSPGETGFSYTVGAVFYDLTGSTPVPTNIGKGRSASDARDVSDDGKVVVGSVDQMPAVCRNVNGEWKWEILPLPDISMDIAMEDFNTGEVSVQKKKINGGHVNAVTPDGKYGVGLGRCNEYELFEQAIMWDLENMKVIDVDYPRTTWNGVDEHQTRFLNLSDDGRYILGWNSFSYQGSTIYVFDRQENKTHYIDLVEGADGKLAPRLNDYMGLELDGSARSLTSDGHYVSGGIYNVDTGACYMFVFDVWNDELTVMNDGVHDDVTAWSVTKDGMPLGGTPSVTPYADAVVWYDNFLYPFSTLYDDVYGMNMTAKYGIDNTGKPCFVSDDGRTIVFITSQTETYVARFKEDLKDALARVNLMADWVSSPVSGSQMAAVSSVTVGFGNPIETDPSKASQIKLLDSKGNQVATPLANGGLQADVNKLKISFRARALEAGETYTLSIPAGVCWVKGRPNDINDPIEIKYVGRSNTPVVVKSVSPAQGTSLPNLDLTENPVRVKFDAAVILNATDSRPIAYLYGDDAEEAYAPLIMDVDGSSHELVIYPPSKVFLYKDSEYTIKVPAAVVTDLSGQGPNEAFEINYTGSYVPQIGDDMYLFSSNCDDFGPFLFYEGDKGTPTAEYAAMDFTADSTPWWVVMDEGINDMAFASHSCYVDGRASDDWVVTRQISIPADLDTYMTFQGQSYRRAKEDYLKIYVYENNTVFNNNLTASTIADIRKNGDLVFNERLDPGRTEGNLQDEWTDYKVDLSKYKGKNIYIAFVNDNQNQSMVMIDNIRVVKNVNSFITLRSNSSVVAQDSYEVKGILTVVNEIAEYPTLEMSLKDADGNVVSTISEKFSTPLTGGDFYSFTFPKQLPLAVGKEVAYTVEFTLGDEAPAVYNASVRNLAFEPYKRVIVEEFTGRDCQWCPLGILAMENLEKDFGSKVIPVVLHAYQGTDPKGYGILDYAQTVFNGNGSAPNGRINRRNSTNAPMATDAAGNYRFSSIAGGDQLWYDVVTDELSEPTFLDVKLDCKESSRKGSVNYTASITSALDIADQNIRVLGLLLEDGLLDRQSNALYNFDDDVLGQFGKGGNLGYASFYYTFNNVARGYWGQSANGTARLIPANLENGKTYTVDIEYQVPSIVEKLENTKMVVVLIDENTGKVVNAAVMSDFTGVEDIIADNLGSDISISKVGASIVVAADGEVEAAVYGMDGQLLSAARGNGQLSLGLDGYKGVVIVRAVAAGQSVTKKIML